MSFSKIRSALIQGAQAVNLGGIPMAFENAAFNKPANSPWASVFVLPNQPSVGSLGSGGTDVHTGIMQVDVNVPVGSGESVILQKADAVSAYFTAGKRLIYNAQEVLVRSCGRSSGRNVDGWYRISLTIDWYAQTPRS